MKAFIEASRRLRADYQPGLWIGAIRPAFGAGEVEQDGRIERYPPHYLVALWPPLPAAHPVLPRWPAVAAIASPDGQAALLELMRHVPADARVWLADEAVDWALVADIVRLSDRHLAPYHHRELERFIAARRAEDAARIRAEYSDIDAGFQALKRRLLPPQEGGAG
ncbi:hypothetical protein IS481_05170 [Caldimonas thermodepolymerans]|jgi:hypothetical protein|uniref:Uncharacterized protein n=1 Tax=Caldimonas thermodepolymerans TaxID=215580 RepID=A0A2S5T8P4_9BURK|nr:hypothetical protein [Caldimonas thermodepolymerans]PPE71385.1 hypothetical protein C1702_02915 [Caldimonas thermodepolymerans]QPC32561.1 hypothetical protein IS481_05170 [Caldimonas thermodepolymerans]RDH98958.1 hypothetical protein DES46_106230 [Caldimonas thermodepolymerans]TCP06357.1 hypothetical protein EV676_107228 [Caldimonas thermodepolymerans]UZG45362.1 hypothetical protein ONZ46_05245 [Caldimonas thermodepolymerans]